MEWLPSNLQSNTTNFRLFWLAQSGLSYYISTYMDNRNRKTVCFTAFRKWAAWSIAVWEYLGRNTSGSSLNSANRKNTLKSWYSWVVKIRNTSEAVLRPQYTPWHYTEEEAVWGAQYCPRLLYWPRSIGPQSVYQPRGALWPEFCLWGVSYFYYPTIFISVQS